jgi:signal transduction histidine kinase
MTRWDAVAGALLGVFAATVVVQALALRTTGDPSDLLFMAAAVPSVVIGFIIARRQPTNMVGPVLMLVGLLPEVVFASQASAHLEWFGAGVAGTLADLDWILLYLGPIALALIFPTGRLLSPAWRVVAVGCVVVPVSYLVLGALQGPEILAIILPLMMFALLIASVVSAGIRYRRGDEVERRQLRWLAVSAVLAPAALATCWAGYLIFSTDQPVGWVLLLLFVALPVSVGIAMLRHRLYGFDRVLSRTVLWATLIFIIGLLFATLVVVLGSVIGDASPIVAAIATIVCAVVFLPLHRALRRWIDARFRPARERAIRAVRAFVAEVSAERARPEDLEAVLREVTGDARLAVSGTSIVPGEASALTASDVRELELEARLPLELGRLQSDLRTALDQTAASRARLVKAADDERGRIQRDLHDGAQQNLVALGMRLRTLQRSPDPRPEEFEDAVALVQRTIAELRSLAQGVRPSALDEGLEKALRTMVRSVPLPVDLDLEPITVSDAVATAAYYTAAEAVTNALKHAGAQRIRVALDCSADGMRLTVSDDGHGGANEGRGSGLAGIRDRVEAASGRLTVQSTPSSGTRVEAVFP